MEEEWDGKGGGKVYLSRKGRYGGTVGTAGR